MDFSFARNIFLGVEFRIWGILVQNGWWNQYYGVPLTNIAGQTNELKVVYPSNTYQYAAKPNSIVFIDEYNEIWPSGVIIYDMGNPLPSGQITVDYINATFTLANTPSGAVTADLAIFEVDVRRGYPEEHELELIDLPVIASEPLTNDGEPFIIGSAEQLNKHYYNLYVMARNDGERLDLTDDVRRNVRFIPYIDFTSAQPLDENNALNLNWSYADQLVSRTFIRRGIAGSYLEPKVGGSDKERYRSLIAFEIEQIA